MNTTNELDQLTPGDWRWVFVSTAGQWFLLGNNGEGPIVSSGPNTADGRLKQAAPALLAVLTEGIGIPVNEDFAADLESVAWLVEDKYPDLRDQLRAKAQAIRAAIAEARGGGGRMKTQIIGYIVTSEYFGEPLQLIEDGPYPWPVLLRADFVTVFKTRKAANAAIDKTIEWAGVRENEDENLKPLEWADKNKYKIWRLCPPSGTRKACPTAAEGEARGQ